MSYDKKSASRIEMITRITLNQQLSVYLKAILLCAVSSSCQLSPPAVDDDDEKASDGHKNLKNA